MKPRIYPRHWLTALIDLMDRPEWRFVGAVATGVCVPLLVAICLILGVTLK